jgi:hypothetical protein
MPTINFRNGFTARHIGGVSPLGAFPDMRS